MELADTLDLGSNGFPCRFKSCRPYQSDSAIYAIDCRVFSIYQLGKRDRFVLGHFYGIYGYEKMIKAELALRLELTIDGVYKARDAAVRHAKDVYYSSALHL